MDERDLVGPVETVEELDGELVLATAPGPVERPAAAVVAKQAAAVAATSLVAGMATVAAVQVGRSQLQRRARRRRSRALPVLATRSFLVDVHLLGSEQRRWKR